MSSIPPPQPPPGGGIDRRRGKRRRTSSGGKRRNTSTLDQAPPAAAAAEDEASSPSRQSHVLSEEELHELEHDVGEELRFDNVVKVFATVQEPDYATPWQTLGVEGATGSGVVIRTSDGKLLILTAAHVISDCTFLQCQRVGAENPDKHIATVYAVRHECDLALLEVDIGKDNEFWHDMEPATLSDGLPSLRSVVLVAGFPVGGEELSITEGVVSRIEGQPYSHSQRYLLAVTVDAAINEGNSGGPVFSDSGELLGIAFQALEGAENTGHIIPPPVIEHFINGVAASGPDGYKGYPADGIKTQHLTNSTLRSYYNLDASVRGVLVTDVYYNNTCHGILQKTDILTRVSDRPVANNGTVAYGNGRVDLSIIFTLFQCDETIDLDIIRSGKAMKVQAIAKPFVRLVPLAEHDLKPRYFIYCGLVFQPLSYDYLDAIDGSSPILTALFYGGHQNPDKLEWYCFPIP
mmetsp:Transcript_33222/g.72849  ORF Transcript_33222/g.72849 Transcript_33222/m.72849 type:complete len:463 (-) Transcript_33222:300-1688(-)